MTFAVKNLKLCRLLSMCFNGCLLYGILPNAKMSVSLVSLLKDEAGKLNNTDNYRPFALASILSKVPERTKLEMYVLTHVNQFGFKIKHGTDMCIYALPGDCCQVHESEFICIPMFDTV